jgi:hypothetical protein
MITDRLNSPGGTPAKFGFPPGKTYGTMTDRC